MHMLKFFPRSRQGREEWSSANIHPAGARTLQPCHCSIFNVLVQTHICYVPNSTSTDQSQISNWFNMVAVYLVTVPKEKHKSISDQIILMKESSKYIKVHTKQHTRNRLHASVGKILKSISTWIKYNVKWSIQPAVVMECCISMPGTELGIAVVACDWPLCLHMPI